MATELLSSPMGPPASRLDIFRPPDSPLCVDSELPPDFDASFGSSMSISSLASAAPPAAAPSSLSQALKTPAEDRTAARHASFRPAKHAADGDENAAPPSSPYAMDISPAPQLAEVSAGPASAMKTDSPMVASSSSFLARSGGFGRELSLNGRSATHPAPSASSVFDSEPPLKKRPGTLPIAAGFAAQGQIRRMSAGGSARPGGEGGGFVKRPSLFSSFTTVKPPPVAPSPASPAASPNASGSGPRHRSSEPSLPTLKSVGKSSRSSKRPSSSSSSDFGQADDGMDVDSPAARFLGQQPETILESPPAVEEEPEGDAALGSYFFDPVSPDPVSRQIRRKPSLLSPGNLSSSPMSSPSNRVLPPRAFEKAKSMGNALQSQSQVGLGPKRSSLGKRSNPYTRRPPLQTLGLQSAYPILNGGGEATTNELRQCAPQPRRALSVADAAGAGGRFRRSHGLHLSDDLSGSPGSKPRGGLKSRLKGKATLSPGSHSHDEESSEDEDDDEVDDEEDEERITHVGLPPPVGSSPYGSEGLPGFGASEMRGKVLPCFSVKDDGLMRIKAQTLRALLEGEYDDRVEDYHIVDCRFAYEYQGGHVQRAINLSTMDKVKSWFLTPGDGLHAGGKPLPLRSQSGKPDAAGKIKKSVLVFHCEFSAKRAPSMALHLRQADRMLAHDYPNCHFPEIYVLQGGYSEFFRSYPEACEPRGYVRMDDPKFQHTRNQDLNGFRRQFNRHRSFTFGDTLAAMCEQQNHQNCNGTCACACGASGGGPGPEAAAPTRTGVGGGGGGSKASAFGLSGVAGGGGIGGRAATTIREEDSATEDSPSAPHHHPSRPAGRLGATTSSCLLPSLGSTGDVSGADSSFEGPSGDSPCAAASKRPLSLLDRTSSSSRPVRVHS